MTGTDKLIVTSEMRGRFNERMDKLGAPEMKLMEVVVVSGSRTFPEDQYDEIRKRLETVCGPNTILRHGGATGADKAAGRAAKKLGVHVEIYPADWGRFPGYAGFKRNIEMLQDPPQPKLVMAFWDGKSPGTEHMIEQTRFRDIKLWVVRFDEW
jgi:hypothetical protein